jgi:hypothetical protein
VSPVWITSPAHVSRQARADWRRRRSVAFAVCFAVLTSFASSATAQQSKPEEYQVKAVYLYNFGRFIDWPATGNKDDSFTICVLGRDPFGAVLDATLAGETIGDKKLVARRLASTLDATNCNILFISSSESSRMKQILAAVEKNGVLTVSDLPNFTINGGMIQFVLRDNKVRFEVNLAAAERAGLTFSSQLLKVATDVMQ